MTFQRLSTNPVGVKLVIIGVMILVLLIPASMIKSLINERKVRRDQAITEISSKWGESQTIIGPILTVPFKVKTISENNKVLYYERNLNILPDNLNIEGKINPEIRYRGIYEAVVYKSDLSLSGSFSRPTSADLPDVEGEFLWEKAILTFGITDLRGISEKISVTWNNNSLAVLPGLNNANLLESGITAKSPIGNEKDSLNFLISMQLNGSQTINFAPVGEETRTHLVSDWTNPSFSGDFLPETRTVNEKGFDAQWKVYYLNRNYPQKWDDTKGFVLNETVFGVELLPKVDEYQKTERTTKYAILFLTLTFLSFFISELLSDRKVHPFQYLLIGFALLIFYSLLLSLTEYMNFRYAYLIAATAIISMITFYTKAIINETKVTAIISGILVLLYSYLYVILQLQDFALLMGNIGLFIILGIVMYITRKIDWYGFSNKQ